MWAASCRVARALQGGGGEPLTLVLRKRLEDRLAAARSKSEWGALLMDLDRLQEIETEQEGKHFILRTPVTGDVGRAFQAVGVALPPNIREADAVASTQ
jgi:hypothetical protein